jgi:curli biogenesis system outer membrane secretion channel CsgG
MHTLHRTLRALAVGLGAILLMAPAALGAPAAQQQGGKKRMGVPPFTNSPSNVPQAGERMADMLVSELMRNRNYDLIERARLENVAKELHLGMTGLTDQSNAARAGKIANLDYMVLGSILEAVATEKVSGSKSGLLTAITPKKDTVVVATELEVKVTVSLKVLEVESGKLVFVEKASASESYAWGDKTQKGTPEQYLSVAQKAIAEAAFKIIRAIAPPEPAVVKVKKVKGNVEEVVVDMGREEGMSEGQRLAIVREGEPIIGRDGKIIGVDITVIAFVTVTRVEATTSYCKVVKTLKDPDSKVSYEIAYGDLLRPQSNTKARSIFEWGKDKTGIGDDEE